MTEAPPRPSRERLLAALEAGWPAAETLDLGPFRLRRGAGGGQRVSATTVSRAFTSTELHLALKEMAEAEAEAGQKPVFQILPSQAPSKALDTLLAERGWVLHDPVSIYLIEVAKLAALPLPYARTFHIWPPLAIQREIWAADGIGRDRLAVMARAKEPRTTLLGRRDDRAAGTAFLAVADGIAGLHALVVSDAHRRHGIARQILAQAGRWAADHGAAWLGLAVTRHNEPARALYASLGMVEVEQYHYRIPGEGPV